MYIPYNSRHMLQFTSNETHLIQENVDNRNEILRWWTETYDSSAGPDLNPSSATLSQLSILLVLLQFY